MTLKLDIPYSIQETVNVSFIKANTNRQTSLCYYDPNESISIIDYLPTVVYTGCSRSGY